MTLREYVALATRLGYGHHCRPHRSIQIYDGEFRVASVDLRATGMYILNTDDKELIEATKKLASTPRIKRGNLKEKPKRWRATKNAPRY